jgi:hypothetical protein
MPTKPSSLGYGVPSYASQAILWHFARYMEQLTIGRQVEEVKKVNTIGQC